LVLATSDVKSRVAAARAGSCGLQIMAMDHLPARLAGELIRPIGPDTLHEAIVMGAVDVLPSPAHIGNLHNYYRNT
jgi:hypothetical protein